MRNLKSLAELTNVVTNVREVLHLPLDSVISKPQVRVQFRNLNELAQSLKEEGQQSPIIVSPPNSLGQYVIQKGERRWRAAKLAGLTTIDAIVNSKDQNPADLLAGQLIENIQRENLLPLEIGVAIGQLIQAGWQQKKIAQRLGKSESYVSLYANISEIDDGIKEVHDAGLVTDSSSLFTLKKMLELDEIYTRNFLKEIQEKGSVSRTEVRQRMAQLQAPQQSENESSLKNDSSSLAQPGQHHAEEPEQSPTPTDQQVSSLDKVHPSFTPTAQEEPTDEETDDIEQEVLSKDTQLEKKTSGEPVEIIKSDAKVVAPNDYLVEVLVSMENGDDQIGKLLIGHLSEDADKAWVLIDNIPVEVSVTSVALLEIRERND